MVTICTTRFNTQKFYVPPTQCIYVFCVDLRTNSEYWPKEHWLVLIVENVVWDFRFSRRVLWRWLSFGTWRREVGWSVPPTAYHIPHSIIILFRWASDWKKQVPLVWGNNNKTCGRSRRNYTFLSNFRPRQLSRHSDSLRAGRSGDRILVVARFSASLQSDPEAHSASCTIGTASPSWG